jgi:hypothetical protein
MVVPPPIRTILRDSNNSSCAVPIARKQRTEATAQTRILVRFHVSIRSPKVYVPKVLVVRATTIHGPDTVTRRSVPLRIAPPRNAPLSGSKVICASPVDSPPRPRDFETGAEIIQISTFPGTLGAENARNETIDTSLSFVTRESTKCWRATM